MKSRRLKAEAKMGDLLARAVEREAAAGRVEFAMEGQACCAEGRFKCCVCGRWRGNDQRREPGSEVCVKCVEAAGFSD